MPPITHRPIFSVRKNSAERSGQTRLRRSAESLCVKIFGCREAVCFVRAGLADGTLTASPTGIEI